jgi:hypothetical protein
MTFILLGVGSVSYTGIYFNINDIISLPSMLHAISEFLFNNSNLTQEIPKLNIKPVKLVDFQKKKNTNNVSRFNIKDIKDIVGLRPYF